MFIDSRKIARLCAQAASDKKAEDIIVLDLKKLNAFTDFFVICTGRSTVQVKSIAEFVQEKVEESSSQMLHIEGTEDSGWLLVDCGDVVVHIFDGRLRNFYSLERLWGEAESYRLTETDRLVRGAKR